MLAAAAIKMAFGRGKGGDFLLFDREIHQLGRFVTAIVTIHGGGAILRS